MDVEVSRLLGQPEKLAFFLNQKKLNEILITFDNLFAPEEITSKKHASDVFEGFLLKICEYIVDKLWVSECPVDCRQTLSSFFFESLQLLEEWKMERLCFRLVQNLSNECAEKPILFELLGKLLGMLEKSSDVITSMVKSMCTVEWSKENMPLLLKFLRSYPLKRSSNLVIIKKVMKEMETFDNELFSALLTELLSFSDPNNFGEILIYLKRMFGDENSPISKSFMQTIFFLAKQDEKIAKNLIQAVKVAPLLTSSILTTFSDNHRISESSFLRELCDLYDDPTDELLDLTKFCSSNQWEFTIQGMIILGFTLLRSGSSMAKQSGSAGAAARKPKVPKAQMNSPFVHGETSKNNVPRCALNILVQLFKDCPSARDEIMHMTTNIIWSESSRPIALSAVDLLGELVAICPQEVASRASVLNPIIDSMSLIPLGLCTSLVHSILPLLRAGNLLDNNLSETDTEVATNPFYQVRARLLANLCKASSSPRIQNRIMSVTCFALMLKHLKVSVSSFRSASQYSSASSSLSQPFLCSQSQATQRNPLILYTQLQSTQVARQAILLPCDISQNEALCTEIIGMLHRIVFSAFFCSQSGGMMEDPENYVRSEIYWSLCEVVTRNRGLCEPVLNLYLRLLTGCLAPSFLKTVKSVNASNPLTVPTVLVPSQTNHMVAGPLLDLSKLIVPNSNGTGYKHSEHPDILIWCLQLIITLPIFNSSWKRYKQRFKPLQDGSETSRESSESTGSQFTQFGVASSIECGRSVSSSLFSKAVSLLTCISESLRLTPREEFGLNTETDFSATPVGKLNRKRAQLLIGVYDACLEFELKDCLDGVQPILISGSQNLTQHPPELKWSRIRQLFARRVALRNLVFGKSSGSIQPGQGSFLLPSFRHSSDCRAGLLALSLVSAAQANLRTVLRESLKSEGSGSLAYHLLHTISARMTQFTHCSGGSIPCAYRDQLVLTIAPILREIVLFYNFKSTINTESLLSSTKPTANTNNSISFPDNVNNPDPDVDTDTEAPKSRPSSTVSSSSAALGVLHIALTLALHYLGTKRLHKLCCLIYSATNNPVYIDNDGATDQETEEPDTEKLLSEVPPAQALSSLIKLIKGWITKLLNPSTTANMSSTQKQASSSSSSSSATKDLVILLPLLVKLCRARASLGSDASTSAKINPYVGLDRVLAWLVRLMHSPVARGGKFVSTQDHANAMVTSARVQLVNQTIWLSHLVGSHSDSRATGTKDLSLNMDDLLLNLATDLNIVFGNLNKAQNSSILTDDTDHLVTYPLVNRSTALSLLPLICFAIRHLLSEFEWLLSHISLDSGGRQLSADSAETIDTRTKLDGNRPEESLCLRLVNLGEILAQLLQTAVPAPSSHADNLLEIGARVFNLLTQLAKYYLRIVRLKIGRFPVVFERVVRVFGREVSPQAYALISYIQSCESEAVKALQDQKDLKKKNTDLKVASTKTSKKSPNQPNFSASLVSRSIKESKLIPQLIYAIEQYERFLMQLSKKSKINLMRNVKLSMSRDFRINQATVVAQLERSAALSLSSESEQSESDKEGADILEPDLVELENVNQPDEIETIQPGVPLESGDSNHDSGDDEENIPPLNPSVDNDARTPAWGRNINLKTQRKSALKRSYGNPSDPQDPLSETRKVVRQK